MQSAMHVLYVWVGAHGLIVKRMSMNSKNEKPMQRSNCNEDRGLIFESAAWPSQGGGEGRG